MTLQPLLRTRLKYFLNDINSVLLYNNDIIDKELNNNEKLVLRYLSLTSSPLYRDGVEKYLTPNVIYYGTGRCPNNKEYVLGRLTMWRSFNPYNKDVIDMIQNIGNMVYVVRRNYTAPGIYTLYTFQINNNKITQYSKMMDYLYGTKQSGYIGEISRNLVASII